MEQGSPPSPPCSRPLNSRPSAEPRVRPAVDADDVENDLQLLPGEFNCLAGYRLNGYELGGEG